MSWSREQEEGKQGQNVFAIRSAQRCISNFDLVRGGDKYKGMKNEMELLTESSYIAHQCNDVGSQNRILPSSSFRDQNQRGGKRERNKVVLAAQYGSAQKME